MIHAAQTVQSDKKRGMSELIPLHFIPSNRVGRAAKLLAAFGALVLSKSHRIQIDFARCLSDGRKNGKDGAD